MALAAVLAAVPIVHRVEVVVIPPVEAADIPVAAEAEVTTKSEDIGRVDDVKVRVLTWCPSKLPWGGLFCRFPVQAARLSHTPARTIKSTSHDCQVYFSRHSPPSKVDVSSTA